MIIDGHIHLSREMLPTFAHASPFTAEMLLKQMDGPFLLNGRERRIDLSLVMVVPRSGEENLRAGHSYILESCKKYPKRLAGIAMVNPWSNQEKNLDELDHLVREDGFRQIKLHPSAHGYRITRANIEKMLSPILEKVEKLKVPVLIHTGDPFAEPARFAPLAEMFPKVNFILAHFGTQMISYAADAIHIAKAHDNVYLETGWAPQPRLKDGAEELGADKLVFGSDSPVNDAGTWLSMVASLHKDRPLGIGMSEEDVEKILGDNYARLLGISHR